MTFAQRIAAIRKEKKWTQEKLGEMVNMTQRSVAAWEAGTRQPSYPVLIELAQKLDVSVDYLLGRTDERTKKEPAVSDDELRAQTMERISALPEPVLLKLLELMDAIQSHPADGSAAPAAPGSSDPSGQQSPA